MTAVFKHELRSYFHSLTAYVRRVPAGLHRHRRHVLYNLQAAVSNFKYVLSFASLVFVVIVPVLTMRVLAEERRQKTDQLLYSLPITTVQIIAGKYLALLVLYLIPLAIIAVYPLIFAQFGDVYLLTSYGSILAFFPAGRGPDRRGGLSLLADRQPGAGRRPGHRGHSAELLQRQPLRVCLLHPGGGAGRPAGAHSGGGCRGALSDPKQQTHFYGVCLVLLAAVAALYFVDSTAFEACCPRSCPPSPSLSGFTPLSI